MQIAWLYDVVVRIVGRQILLNLSTFSVFEATIETKTHKLIVSKQTYYDAAEKPIDLVQCIKDVKACYIVTSC